MCSSSVICGHIYFLLGAYIQGELKGTTQQEGEHKVAGGAAMAGPGRVCVCVCVCVVMGDV